MSRYGPTAPLPALVLPCALALAMTLGACAGDAGPDAQPSPSAGSVSATPSPPATDPATVRPEVSLGATVATGLEVPWGLTVLPDGSSLVAERISGRVLRLPVDATEPAAVGTVPGVVGRGEGGLLGLTVAPGSTNVNDVAVYAYLTTANDNRVVSFALRGGRLGPPTPIVTGIPSGGIHNGGRIAFGPDGKLWITTGDAGIRELSQDRDSLAGKILRANADGTIPDDNPFGTLVWSWGHRNVQGLAWDSSGQPWATEFGSSESDELNEIRRGGNYGWPIVEGAVEDERFETPAVTWPTSEASPSGIAIVDDIAYVAALRGQRLWQVPLRGDEAGQVFAQLEGDLGRIRTVEALPDGGLLVATSNRDGRGNPSASDDRVVRITLDRP